jgi:pseudouridine-5'-phosphate glycosidase
MVNMKIKDDVREALEKGKPVIALESTIISHGMPYPKNVETALEMEQLAREMNVTPATIGIIDGTMFVGLDEKQIDYMGKAVNVTKISRRDFGYIVSRKKTGATTVAGTMIIANMAGIKVFATGGIGGVHRDAETTFDISADLSEFARTPVIVVSAGAKAILDLPKTLEILETNGVPVIGYGTYEFPAFYSVESGSKLTMRLDRPNEIALAFKTSIDLGFNTGMVVANPIPKKDEIPRETMENFIRLALNDMKLQKISGKNVTPYLLSRISELTNGKSLKANISLVRNNVALACEIATELIKLM